MIRFQEWVIRQQNHNSSRNLRLTCKLIIVDIINIVSTSTNISESIIIIDLSKVKLQQYQTTSPMHLQGLTSSHSLPGVHTKIGGLFLSNTLRCFTSANPPTIVPMETLLDETRVSSVVTCMASLSWKIIKECQNIALIDTHKECLTWTYLTGRHQD